MIDQDGEINLAEQNLLNSVSAHLIRALNAAPGATRALHVAVTGISGVYCVVEALRENDGYRSHLYWSSHRLLQPGTTEIETASWRPVTRVRERLTDPGRTIFPSGRFPPVWIGDTASDGC